MCSPRYVDALAHAKVGQQAMDAQVLTLVRDPKADEMTERQTKGYI